MAKKKTETKQKEEKKNVLTTFSLSFILNPLFLRAMHRYLNMTVLALAVIFAILIFVPTIKTDISEIQQENLADGVSFVGVLLFINSILLILVNFISISIRSKKEQEEEERREQVREQVREIDLKLNTLSFRSRYTVGRDEEIEVGEEFETLTLERDRITGKGLHRLELLVSANWSQTLVESHKRLLDEEERLNARNVANLGYGVLAAVLGVFVLITAAIIPYIWESFQTPAFNGIPVYYFPVTPVVIISEIVAIFFLRLHSQTEHRLERNKNEITNIELRLAAGLMLPSPAGQPDFTSLSNHLAKEERNFVLGKNESSAGIGVDRVAEILSKVIKGGVS